MSIRADISSPSFSHSSWRAPVSKTRSDGTEQYSIRNVTFIVCAQRSKLLLLRNSFHLNAGPFFFLSLFKTGNTGIGKKFTDGIRFCAEWILKKIKILNVCFSTYARWRNIIWAHCCFGTQCDVTCCARASSGLTLNWCSSGYNEIFVFSVPGFVIFSTVSHLCEITDYLNHIIFLVSCVVYFSTKWYKKIWFSDFKPLSHWC